MGGCQVASRSLAEIRAVDSKVVVELRRGTDGKEGAERVGRRAARRVSGGQKGVKHPGERRATGIKRASDSEENVESPESTALP